MLSILLVDDHELVRTGVRGILSKEADFEVVGEASSGEEAIDLVKQYKPDLVLMDVNMPGIGGMESTRKLLRIQPELKIIALTVHAEEPFPAQLLEAGAMGYLTKGCPAAEMIEAIRLVAKGRRFIAASIAQKMTLASLGGIDTTSPFASLSQREMQIMMMVTQGIGISDIADSLCLSPKTVSTYRYRIYEKLDVSNDVELTRMAIRHNVIES
ncbi:MAG: UvrY/SirA/GacA family response regulator transcription factor [gamma proteobacterium symbiont of Bathyaustriella thionipta]|nr:UvrY/SirA/GacA family response regulator transcription factor [gamma proteobacterium symbiont of Bathyaustriella thionipta]